LVFEIGLGGFPSGRVGTPEQANQCTGLQDGPILRLLGLELLVEQSRQVNLLAPGDRQVGLMGLQNPSQPM
jgi:hypothetical protein